MCGKKINLSIFALVFILLLMRPYKAFAININYDQAVDANKSWTIKFNDYVGFDDLTKSEIVVTDSKGNNTNVSLTQGDDKKSVIVNAPKEGYTQGESYTLTIGKKAHSSNGKSLKEVSVLHFNIKKQEVTVKYFPLLSDVPEPHNINYVDEYKDGDTVVYLYNISDITSSDFVKKYADMLQSYGWKYYKYDKENYTMYFFKGSDVIIFGAVESYVEVAGNIH